MKRQTFDLQTAKKHNYAPKEWPCYRTGELCVHRMFSEDLYKGVSKKAPWQISHVRTGMGVCSGRSFKSFKAAIACDKKLEEVAPWALLQPLEAPCEGLYPPGWTPKEYKQYGRIINKTLIEFGAQR